LKHLNILHLVKEFNHGGVATHVTDLSVQLIKRNHLSIVALLMRHI